MNTNQPSMRHLYGAKIFDYSKRPYIMGILNVTPDSFSDGGRFSDPDAAAERALEMIDQGADIIDIGGESTRPGSSRIPAGEEIDRVIPVIEEILKHNTNAVISIDTYKSEVAEVALEHGALIVNDVSALRFDENMAAVAGKHNASMILMHMKGEPKTMQDNPYYENVVNEVKNFFTDRTAFAKTHAITQIILDPGIGFGKRVQDNLELLRSLHRFTELGYPVLIGPSRKSFIGKILNLPVDQRLEGSLAAAVIGIVNGASIVRVHDVAATKRAVRLTHAISLGTDFLEDITRVT